MLNKVFVKIHGRKPKIIYIGSKNFQFDGNVYNAYFEQINIDTQIYEDCCDLIKQNVLTSETMWECDGYDIALGTPVDVIP